VRSNILQNNYITVVFSALAQTSILASVVATDGVNSEGIFGAYFYIMDEKTLVTVDDFIP
jgi:hypothetical protein